MSELIICTEIRKVGNGYTVKIRNPFGPEVVGFGTVVCKTWKEVIELITKANIPHFYEKKIDGGVE